MPLAPVALRAVAAGLQKVGYNDQTALKSLARQAITAGATQAPSLRRWLANSSVLTPRLRRHLVEQLAPEDKQIGAYTLLYQLAQGGMGTVALAAGPSDRLVVVKRLRPEMASGSDFAQRFLREAHIMRSLKDPHVVRCLDAGDDDLGGVFLAMEYVNGGDLRQLIKRDGPLPEGQALLLASMVARGLAAADRLNLVHRDLKPANIFITKRGIAKLGDFGLARSTRDDRTVLTLEGTILGTPAFMSPEQVRGDDNIDIRSDLYALGAVLYTALTGEMIFAGTTGEILDAQLCRHPPSLQERRPDLHDRTYKTVAKLLRKEADGRFQSPGRLIRSLLKTIDQIGLEGQVTLDETTIAGAQAVYEDSRTQSAAAPEPIPSAPPTPTAITAPDPITRPPTVQQPPKPATSPPPEPDVFDAFDVMQTIPEDSEARAQANAIPAITVAVESTPSPASASEHNQTPEPACTIDLPDGDAAAMTIDSEDATLDDGSATLDDISDSTHTWTGTLADAATEDWLILRPASGDPGPLLLCYARDSVTLGKLRKSPIDLCLRVYPVDKHRDACRRVSAQHAIIAYDPTGQRCTVTDLASSNGSVLDERTLNPHQACTLEPSRRLHFEIPNAIALCLECLPQRSRQVASLFDQPGSGAGPGIDGDHAVDAVIIRRPSNRTDLVAAQVLRRLTCGPGGDVPEIGATPLELARFAGRWIARESGGAWFPANIGSPLGSSGLIATAGDYEVFQ